MRGAAAFAALEPGAGAGLAWDEFCLFDFGMSLHGGKVAQTRTKVRHGHWPQLLSLPGEGSLSSKRQRQQQQQQEEEEEEVTNWSGGRAGTEKGLETVRWTPSEPHGAV